MNETETAVSELLADVYAITYKTRYVCETNRDGWKCDQWHIRFERGPAAFALDYFTGLGHRSPAPMPADGGKRPRPGTLMHEQLEKARKPVPPSAAGVIYSVISDDTHGATFADWCADCGMDTDSRKALTIYEQCQNQTAAAFAFFGRDGMARFAELLADY